jgi:hypothetical protein
MHGRSLGDRDLGDDVRRGAEAVDAQRASGRQRGAAQGPVPDDARAQQGRCLDVPEGVGQPVRVALGNGGELGVPTVSVPTGERRVRAEVLLPPAAPAAAAAGAPQPRDADAVPRCEAGRALTERVDDPDDLVPRHGAATAWEQIAFGQVQVGPADAARRDPHPDLTGLRSGRLAGDRAQGVAVDRSGCVHDPGAHRSSVVGGDRRDQGRSAFLPTGRRYGAAPSTRARVRLGAPARAYGVLAQAIAASSSSWAKC